MAELTPDSNDPYPLGINSFTLPDTGDVVLVPDNETDVYPSEINQTFEETGEVMTSDLIIGNCVEEAPSCEEWSVYEMIVGTDWYGNYGYMSSVGFGTLTLVSGPDLSISELWSEASEGYTVNYKSTSECTGMTDVIISIDGVNALYTLNELVSDWSAEYYDSSGNPSYFETNNNQTVTLYVKLSNCDMCNMIPLPQD